MWNVSRWEWKLRWRRLTFEWEREQLTQLVIDLNRVRINQDYLDKVVWATEEGDLFYVKSAYQVL